MMRLSLHSCIILLITLILFFLSGGCDPGEETADRSATFDGDGISIEGAWARPGSMGRMSAGYFLVTNFEDEPDTLTGVSSNIAQLTEIHESYEQQEGMVGMREVPEVVIQPNSTISFEPGGLHIMFLGVEEPFAEGEEIAARLAFEHGDERAIVFEVEGRPAASPHGAEAHHNHHGHGADH
jgi:periplasmic copper chaperone A